MDTKKHMVHSLQMKETIDEQQFSETVKPVRHNSLFGVILVSIILIIVFGIYAFNSSYYLVIAANLIIVIILFAIVLHLRRTVTYEKRIQDENTTLREDNEKLRTAVKLLDESEETIRSLIERSSECIIIIQDECVKLVNSRLSRLGGYRVEDMIGNPFIDYVHPDQRKELRANYLLRIGGIQLPKTYRSVLLHCNGGGINVEISGGRIFMNSKPADLVFVHEIKAKES